MLENVPGDQSIFTDHVNGLLFAVSGCGLVMVNIINIHSRG